MEDNPSHQQQERAEQDEQIYQQQHELPQAPDQIQAQISQPVVNQQEDAGRNQVPNNAAGPEN